MSGPRSLAPIDTVALQYSREAKSLAESSLVRPPDSIPVPSSTTQEPRDLGQVN